MKVLVTGGAGYIGTELVGALARQDAVREVVVYDNLSRKNYNLFLADRLPPGRVRFVHGDLLDSRRLREVLAGVDVVYHLAALVTTPFRASDVHHVDQVNHWGTAELSYALEERPVSRLIYLSSAAVYGATDTPAGVHTPTRPTNAYGESKLQGEGKLARLAEDLSLTVLRCANVYGYSRSLRFDAVINRFLFEAHYGHRITIHGSGRQHRAFVHIDDVVASLVPLAVGEAQRGTYNLVERNLSINDIAGDLRQLYPDLEMLHLDQDHEPRSLELQVDERVRAWSGVVETPFIERLDAFQARFSFDPAR